MSAAAAGGSPLAGILVRPFAPVDYQRALAQMREFTLARGPETRDEIWLVEHPAVFTLGLASRQSHLLATGDIPVVQTERGGQVTYHGPGQVVAYLMAMDLEPFSRIDPCGYPGLEVTDLRSQLSAPADLAAFAADLGERLRRHFEELR
jgi:lipoate-protein ligase B